MLLITIRPNQIADMKALVEIFGFRAIGVTSDESCSDETRLCLMVETSGDDSQLLKVLRAMSIYVKRSEAEAA